MRRGCFADRGFLRLLEINIELDLYCWFMALALSRAMNFLGDLAFLVIIVHNYRTQ
jgi:hypothetical protein